MTFYMSLESLVDCMKQKLQFAYIRCHVMLRYFYRSVPVVDSKCYGPYAMTCDDFLYVFRKSSHLHETHLEEF